MERTGCSVMNVTLPTLMVVALVCAGCGGPERAGAETLAGSDAGTPMAAAGSCIADYAERPCELLTESLVRKHVPVTAAIEQADVGARMARPGSKPRTSRTTAFNGCTYSWKGSRTVSHSPSTGTTPVNPAVAAALAKMTREIPVPDRVEVRSILVLPDADPLARFTARWREPTPEERAHIERQMNEAMEKARQDGKVSGAGAGAGRQLGRSVSQAPVTYDPVEGVGTAARWGGVGADRSLKVLHNDTEFAVVVNVSDDEAINRTAAIAIARELLARCGR